MKKAIAAVLAFIQLLLFVSCSNTDSGAAADTTAVETNSEETTGALYDEVEVKNFEGYDFRILENPTVSVFSTHKQVPEEEVGESVIDAFYTRNITVEEKYNITISSIYEDDPTAALKKSVAAGDDISDIAFLTSSTVFGLAGENSLVDFNSVTSMNLDSPWWDKREQESFTIYGKLYMLEGDISTNEDLATLCVLYSKTLYDDYGYENPYSLVSQGNWTMDKVIEMINGTGVDINGDSEMDENDLWGMVADPDSLYYCAFGGGINYIRKTADGEYEFTLNDQKTIDVIEKAFDMLRTDGCLSDFSKYIKDTSVSVYVTIEKMFMDNRVLFDVRLIADALHLRNMESDFGFLPFPKYDENQEEYYGWVTFNVQSPVMPVTVSDIERTGLIMDALSFESMLTIKDPFFETLLGEKIARDSEDKQMLEIVLSSKVYDLDGINTGSGIQSGLLNMFTGILKSGEFTIASAWAKAESSANKKLENFLAELK